MCDRGIPGLAEYAEDGVEEETGEKTVKIQMRRGGDGTAVSLLLLLVPSES